MASILIYSNLFIFFQNQFKRKIQIILFSNYQLQYQIVNIMQSFLQDQFRFKSILFVVLILQIVGAAIGIAFARNIYFFFCLACVTYMIAKFVQMIFILVLVNIRYNQSMKSYQQRKLVGRSSLKQKITHIFILPNFKEDKQTLRQSIFALAKHKRSSEYCLFLAMEAHEQNSQEKAAQLILEFSHHFRVMSFTLHSLQYNELKCKSSNINWCARNMVPKLLENCVSMDSVLVTIMDSDTQIPEAYIDQVECKIEQNFENRHKIIFQPPQIFTLNQKQAAFFVRAGDTAMSYLQCSNLFSIFDYTMAVSNYTISYRLLQRIDFWDTCINSKGEDSRITSKAFWKTNGQIKTCPIYIPTNQMNLTTKEGYWADFKARFIQAHRHCQDQIEISYNLVNLLKSPVNFIRKFHVFLTICEIFGMPITMVVPILVLFFQDVIEILPRSEFDDGSTFISINNINIIIMFTGILLYEFFRTRASRALFGIQPLNILYALQFPILQFPVAIIYGFIPMVWASINMLTSNIVVINQETEPQ